MARHKHLIHITTAAYVLFALSAVILPLDWLFAWLIATSLHELGHFIALKLCFIRIHKIHIAASGAKIETEPLTPGREIICALSGPLAGLSLLLASKWMPRTSICSCVLSIVNVLPLNQFDGSRVLNGCLRLIYSEAKTTALCRAVDGATRVVLLITGLVVTWKLRWGMGLVLCVMLFLRLRRKTPCKEARLQIQ